MGHFLLSASGQDRPGLVAAVAQQLFSAGCNLEDSSMTRLAGEFSMLVIFQGPSSFEADSFGKKLQGLTRRWGLTLHIKALSRRELTPPRTAGAKWLITLYGADRPGWVYHATRALAQSRVNVSDLATHRTGGAKPGYILYIEGESSPTLRLHSLRTRLKKALRNFKGTISVQPLGASAL